MLTQGESLDLPDSQRVERLIAGLQSTRDFQTLFESYGRVLPALRHYGLTQWHARRLDVALEALGAAVTLSPEDPHLWADLAGVYDGLSLADPAEACIRRSLALDTGQARPWQLLASLTDRRGDHVEAEAAYRHALEIEPGLGDAHFGLGILQFNQRHIEDSAASLRAAILHGYANALGYACLGHVLYMAGDFFDSTAAFEAAARFGPLDPNGRRKYARARTFATIIEGRAEAALAAYPQLAGEDQEDIAIVARDAFSLLSAYGHQAAATEIGRVLLAKAPDDPIQRYLLDAVTGRPLRRAPLDYIELYFDRFAPEFDRKLVDVLHYRAPERMQALVARHRRDFARMLDLGCGTGLAAEPLSTFGGLLTGVDISGRMLDEAAKRGRYAALLKSEAIACLDEHPDSFDLVFAADLLVYIGDLDPFGQAASRSLASGGILALSIETSTADDFVLLRSGRFAHSLAYLNRVFGADFDTLEVVAAAIRLEANRPVDGHFIVLRRH